MHSSSHRTERVRPRMVTALEETSQGGREGARTGTPRRASKEKGQCDPQWSPITPLGEGRKYFSGEVCALAATLRKKGSLGKTALLSSRSAKMEIITELYEASGQKKSPPEWTGIVMHRNFRFWTLSNSGRVSSRASLACVSSLDLALLRQGLLSIPSFISCTGS